MFKLPPMLYIKKLVIEKAQQNFKTHTDPEYNFFIIKWNILQIHTHIYPITTPRQNR